MSHFTLNNNQRQVSFPPLRASPSTLTHHHFSKYDKDEIRSENLRSGMGTYIVNGDVLDWLKGTQLRLPFR